MVRKATLKYHIYSTINAHKVYFHTNHKQILCMYVSMNTYSLCGKPIIYICQQIFS